MVSLIIESLFRNHLLGVSVYKDVACAPGEWSTALLVSRHLEPNWLGLREARGTIRADIINHISHRHPHCD